MDTNRYIGLRKKIRLSAWGEKDIDAGSLLSTEEVDKFIFYLSSPENELMLDVCCGRGNVDIYIHQQVGCKILGIDNDSDAIHAANGLIIYDNAPLRFIVADLRSALPFPKNHFDSLICLESIMLFNDVERKGIFQEWQRILKPGAKLIFTDPCLVVKAAPHINLSDRNLLSQCFYLSPEEQEGLLKLAGFKIERIDNITTNNIAIISKSLVNSFEKYSDEIVAFEGKAAFENNLSFYKACNEHYNQLQNLQQYAYYLVKP